MTSSDQLINIKSEQSVAIRNESFAHEHGIIVQEFINPGGYHFDLVTVKQAKVVEQGLRNSEHTFFAGFDWTIVGMRAHMIVNHDVFEVQPFFVCFFFSLSKVPQSHWLGVYADPCEAGRQANVLCVDS